MEGIEEPPCSVFPFSKAGLKQSELMGKSDQADYVLRYLDDDEIKAKTCIEESKYIDKDFIIDYQMFHCRSFEDVTRITKRFHFFANEFYLIDLNEALKSNDTEFFEELNKQYLGFAVVKPLNGPDDEPIIGRTLLKPYPDKGKRYFVKETYLVSLFGINLEIESLPYQSRDERVSACATISLWSALHPLKDAFETPRHSPAEITEISCSSPDDARKFPPTGLSLEQMINYIRRIGLDIEILNLTNSTNDIGAQHFVRTYIDAGLPIIAALRLKRGAIKNQGHAAVISGYKLDDHRRLSELFVHDDVFGPYLKVLPDPNFLKWHYEWQDLKHYEEVKLDKLLVPIYPKIRTNFARMHTEYFSVNKKLREKLGDGHYCELSLTTLRDYKESILKISMNEKLNILTMHLPRFLWVIRHYENDKLIGDGIYDATSVYVKRLAYAEFYDS